VFERRAITSQDVVAAFHGAGIPLHEFPAPGAPHQYTASAAGLNPALVITVFPNTTAAARAEQTLALNGRRVRAIPVRNVRIWVASGAPHDLRRHLTHAMSSLRHVR
jgi:hypothetical protein